MSRRAEPALIGAFVLGGIVIAAAAIVVLGGARLLRQPTQFVVSFNESVKGLRIGAPVDFRGVAIGRVEQVSLVYEPDGGHVHVPVVVEIDPQAIVLTSGARNGAAEIKQLIGQGLKAQLQIESFVTGQLFVALDLHPDRQGSVLAGELPHPQIPSIPSPWAAVRRSIEDVSLDVPNLVRQVERVVTRVDGILAVIEPAKLAEAVAGLPELMAGLRTAAVAAEKLGVTTEAMIAARGEQLAGTLVELERALAGFRRASEQIGLATAENRRNLKDFTERGLPEFAALAEDASRMVNEFTGVLRDMRQNPSRFFFGDPTREGVRPR